MLTLSQNNQYIALMLNKRGRQGRAKTAVHRGGCIQERISFGEDAKQALRNLSLINNINDGAQDRGYKQWTKDEDNLSIGSFHFVGRKKSSKNHSKNMKFKKAGHLYRNSSPVILNSSLINDKCYKYRDKNRKQLVPSSLDINCRQIDQRIHTSSNKHNFINGKQVNLLNEVLFRKTAANFNRSFKAHTYRDGSHEKSQRSFSNRIQLTQRSACRQIIPLKVHDFPDNEGQKQQRKSSLNRRIEQKLTSNNTNKIRKLLKEQRKNNLNETIFQKSSIKPQF